MSDTIPMPAMFRACSDVLDETLMPIHYADLVGRALCRLGVAPEDVNWNRQVEDVREKMLLTGRYRTGYIGKPYCLAFKRDWFPQIQLPLLNPPDNAVFVPGSLHSGIWAAYEAVRRSPFMIQKVKTASPERRFFSGVRGLVIEMHMRDWFKAHWPRLYMEADNYRRWEAPCPHDFKLKIGQRIYTVDIAGEGMDGRFRKNGKHKADLHLLCSPSRDTNAVVWHGVAKGKDYQQDELSPLATTSPAVLVVWLNCLHEGLEYGLFLRRA